MLKFSANLSVLFTEVELKDRFRAARKQDFNAVEIQFPFTLPPETLKTALTQQQLDLVLFNVAAGDLLTGGEGLACVPEKQAQFREAVAQTVDYAQLLKPHAINVLPGRCLNASRKPAYLATFSPSS
jgi:hydroxypyruvate isomerase